MRIVAAIAVAPLAVIPVLIVLFGPWTIANGGLRSLWGIVGPAVVVAYPLVILFGLPMHLALVHAQRTRTRDYAVTGALMGGVPIIGYLLVAVAFEARFAVTALVPALARNAEWGAIGVLVFGLCGTAVAVAYRATVLAFPSGSR